MKITSFVLKIASRCNLNCSYCYMYNLGDKTYLKQPKFMSLNTIEALAIRIRNYSRNYQVSTIQIVFHGGEPLLASKEYFENSLRIFKETVPEVNFIYTVQTNGVLLDDEWYDFFNKHNIIVGISIDGPKDYHDKFRIYNNGRGSYDKVAEAVRLGVTKYNLRGILNVINTEIPPIHFYEEMKKLGIKNVNLLLPDGHYDNLPDGFEKERMYELNYTPYADWLIELFLIWKEDDERPRIKFFEQFIRMIIGEDNIGNQNFGKTTNGVLIIETDGGIEVADSLRACYEGITRNDLNVCNNEISAIFSHKLFQVYYNAHEMVCKDCLACSLYEICGGGFLGTRYSYKNGFYNKMIYCKDIIKLLCFLQNDFLEGLPDEVRRELDVEKISTLEIINERENQKEITVIDEKIKNLLVSFKIESQDEIKKRHTVV